MKDSSPGYFAAKEATKVAGLLLDKAEAWENNITSNGIRYKWENMWRAYHGAYYTGVGSGHDVTFSGEQGELANLPVNHFRNIAQHILNMTTSTRPALIARAVNTDAKSRIQASLANIILDYYTREKRLEEYLKRAVEFAILFGSGWVRMEWDSTLGDIYDVVEDENGNKIPLHDGDIIFSNLSPFDVIFDSTKEEYKNDWLMVRSFKNKYDLSAKYPELKDKIEALKSKSEIQRYRLSLNSVYYDTDDVPVYEFYHVKTASMPNGRYLMFLADDVILHDAPMPYRVIPVFRVACGQILGSQFGYTPMFDLLPIQIAVNSLYSTILTNQSTFGVQNVWVKPGANINIVQIPGGLNILESADKPEAINLTATPKEIFDFLGQLEKTMETISAVNSVARGGPQSSLKSGTALALVQSMALQFNSGLQQSYIQLLEDSGTGLIKILQDFAKSPRLINIVGKTNRSSMKQFSSDDIGNINRVIVDIANPLSRTHSGRVQVADNLLQYMGDKITPSQYVNVMNTGNLGIITQDLDHEQESITSENEAMLNGEPVSTFFADEHIDHIKSHKALIGDIELRKNFNLVKIVSDHIQEHINLLRNTDPATLIAMGQQPIPPAPPVPGNSIPPNVSGPIEQPQSGIQGIEQQDGKIIGPNLPPTNIPKPSKVDASLLPNPQLQEPIGNLKG